MSNLIQRKIYLDEQTDQIVDEHRRQGGFGGKGLSAAIRNIILNWKALTDDPRYRITHAGSQVLAETQSDNPPAIAE